MMESAALQDRGHPIVVLLVLVKRGPGVVPDHLAVGRRWSLHPPVAPITGRTDARVTAGGTRPPVHRVIYQVTVEDGSVGGGPHRLSVELHLLLGVPQLQGAGSLVRGGLLAVRQRDGGRQVDLVLHVGVGWLEPVEAVPLQKGWHGQAVAGSRGVDLLLEGREKGKRARGVRCCRTGRRERQRHPRRPHLCDAVPRHGAFRRPQASLLHWKGEERAVSPTTRGGYTPSANGLCQVPSQVRRCCSCSHAQHRALRRHRVQTVLLPRNAAPGDPRGPFQSGILQFFKTGNQLW